MRRVISTLTLCQHALTNSAEAAIVSSTVLVAWDISLPHTFVKHSHCIYFRVFAWLIFHTEFRDSTHRWYLVGLGVRACSCTPLGPARLSIRPICHTSTSLNNSHETKAIQVIVWQYGSADVSVWWNLIHPIALPCLRDPMGDIFATGLSGTIKSWHHVNTARQYSLIRKVRNFFFTTLIASLEVSKCISVSSMTSWCADKHSTLYSKMQGKYILLITIEWCSEIQENKFIECKFSLSVVLSSYQSCHISVYMRKDSVGLERGQKEKER